MREDWVRLPNPSTHIPLWVQVSDCLRDAINDGAFKVGDLVPSELDLIEIFEISRATSRRALGELEREGLIVRRRGKGSIVQQKKVNQPVFRMRSFSEDMIRRGLVPSYRTLDTGKHSAGNEVAKALEVMAHTRVFRARRLLCADGEPIGVSTSWISPRVLRNRRPPSEEQLSSGSLYSWMQQNCGVELVGAREFIEAAIATDEQADLLCASMNAPLIVARRQSFDQHDKPAEYAVMYFRSDRYRFEIDLRR